MKHSEPFIPAGVDDDARRRHRARDRHRDGAPLVGHVRRDLHRARASRRSRIEGGSPAFTFVRSYHDHPAFVGLPGGRGCARRSTRCSPEDRANAAVIFSAHSLPGAHARRRHRSAASTAIATTRAGTATACRRPPTWWRRRLGLEDYLIAWQSAGRTADPWWGPPIEDVIAAARGAGHTAVVVCSAGFVADHLEILYDLDIEAQRARRRGGDRGSSRPACRTPTPTYLDVLAEVVREHLAGGAGEVSAVGRAGRRGRGRGHRPDDGVPAGRGRRLARRHRARGVRPGGRQAPLDARWAA